MSKSSGASGVNRQGAVYAYYIVLVLMLAYMLSFMDRVLISLMIDPIRHDLGLGDTEIGLLVGFGFVLLYSIFGIPFGAWADSGNRRNLIVVGVLGWSAATVVCGLATSFATLLGARGLVGIGEATLSPAAYSTIADRFEKRKLGLAISLYAAGVTIGGGVAFAFGGYLVGWASEAHLALPWGGTISGWRLAFAAVGFLGVPLALLMLATVREAARQRVAGRVVPPLGAVFGMMRAQRRAFGGVFGGYSLMVIAAYAAMLWAPAYFARVHGMGAREIGVAFGVIIGGFGTLGLIAGGLISNLLARRGMIDAPVRVMTWSIVVQAPFLISAYMLADKGAALACLAVGMMVSSTMGGLQGATLQLLAPEAMRGRVTALYLLSANMAGMGLGPLIVGVLSEHFFSGAAGVGHALALMTAVSLILGFVVLIMTRRAARACIVAREAAVLAE